MRFNYSYAPYTNIFYFCFGLFLFIISLLPLLIDMERWLFYRGVIEILTHIFIFMFQEQRLKGVKHLPVCSHLTQLFLMKALQQQQRRKP